MAQRISPCSRLIAWHRLIYLTARERNWRSVYGVGLSQSNPANLPSMTFKHLLAGKFAGGIDIVNLEM